MYKAVSTTWCSAETYFFWLQAEFGIVFLLPWQKLEIRTSKGYKCSSWGCTLLPCFEPTTEARDTWSELMARFQLMAERLREWRQPSPCLGLMLFLSPGRAIEKSVFRSGLRSQSTGTTLSEKSGANQCYFYSCLLITVSPTFLILVSFYQKKNVVIGGRSFK